MSYGDLGQRELDLLRHIARYGLTFREIVRHVVFRGSDPDRVLGGLKNYNFIAAQKGFGGNRVGYTLLKRGAKAVGAGRRRGEDAGTESEATHLAILGFCFLNRRPRARLETDELADIFGVVELSGRHHCLEYGSRAKRVYGIYVPGPTTPPADVALYIRKRIGVLQRQAELEPWLANGVYALAILVENDERRAKIEARLDETKIDTRPIRDLAEVVVEVVPGRDRLEEALRVLA